MKKAYRLLSFALALCFAAACIPLLSCSCSDDSDDQGDQLNVSGSEATWQELTVFVPDGMELVGGSALDASDPNTAWIQRKGDELSYFLINIVSKERIETTIKTTKDLNSGEDIEFDAGNLHWKGVKYKYAGVSDCFQVYAEVDGHSVLVSGSRFAYDSAEAKAVLRSIKIAD